ncbi:MAG: hypothetical protein IPK32_04065 [Verrucomicrobiaceae bacterium]|nr:hypothetical protein [Verrucomicrobiaceae bacterium]
MILTFPNLSRQKDARQVLHLFALHLFASLLVTSASAQSPATTQRLTLLRTAYEAAYQTEVAAGHTAALTDLNAKYSAALDRALAAATQAGQLDTALALRDEKKRLAAAAPLPADDFAAPETLKTLRLTYRSALASLEIRRDQTAAPVKAKYDAALEALQTELTKAADLDGAMAVKQLREQVKTALAATTPAAPAKLPQAPPSTSGITAGPARTDPEAAQKMMAWVLANGATSLTSVGRVGMNEKIKEVPKGRFSIKTLNINDTVSPFPWELLRQLGEITSLNINYKTPITNDQLQHLASLPSLEELIVKAPLTVSALESLTARDQMMNLHIHQIGDEDLNPSGPSLAKKFPNLENLGWCPKEDQDNLAACQAVQAWPKLHGLTTRGDLSAECVDALSALKELSSLTLLGAGTLDPTHLSKLKNLDHLQASFGKHLPGLVSAAAKLPRLRTFRCPLAGSSPADLTDLTKFPSLDHLTLKLAGSSVPSDDFIPTVTTLKNLTELDLLQSDLTDAGLAQLHGMKKLGKLVLPASRVTEAGIAAFKKALPKCQLGRDNPNF